MVHMFLRALFFILWLLLTPAASFAESTGHLFLRVESVEQKKVLLDLPIQPGDLFYFQYIHSSAKTPIRDTFKVDARGQIILIEETFLWHGAGLEFQEHEDVKVNYNDKWIRVLLNRLFLNLPIRVGRVSQQYLILHGQSYRLDKLDRPGKCIILSIAR